MNEKRTISDSTWFVFGITFISGFLNAYFFKLYGTGISFHTGNMMRIGIALGEGNYQQSTKYAVTVAVFIIGAILYELLNCAFKSVDIKDLALKACAAYSFFLGYSQQILPQNAICFSGVAFFGFYMGIFTKWLGKNFTVSTSTGNLRNLGANIADVIFKRCSMNTLINHAILIFAFPMGSFICTRLILLLGHHSDKSVWLLTVILIEWTIQYNKSQKKVWC